MRITLTILVLLGGLLGAGCGTTGVSPGGCGASACGGCAPKTKKCCTWQPDCCNNWDWYVPCDMIEGRACRSAAAYEQVPTCK